MNPPPLGWIPPTAVQRGLHDPSLNRVTDRCGLIRDTTFTELQGLRVAGVHAIPALIEAIDAFPDAHFPIDLNGRVAPTRLRSGRTGT